MSITTYQRKKNAFILEYADVFDRLGAQTVATEIDNYVQSNVKNIKMNKMASVEEANGLALTLTKEAMEELANLEQAILAESGAYYSDIASGGIVVASNDDKIIVASNNGAKHEYNKDMIKLSFDIGPMLPGLAGAFTGGIEGGGTLMNLLSRGGRAWALTQFNYLADSLSDEVADYKGQLTIDGLYNAAKNFLQQNWSTILTMFLGIAAEGISKRMSGDRQQKELQDRSNKALTEGTKGLDTL